MPEWYLPPNVRAIRQAQRDEEEIRKSKKKALNFRIDFLRDMADPKSRVYDLYSTAKTVDKAKREVTPDVVARTRALGAVGYQIVVRFNDQVGWRETFDA